MIQILLWLLNYQVPFNICQNKFIGETLEVLFEEVKDGVRLNCPLNPELIETIFYEGTRLHDGAMICRGSTIIAANVFLPSTKKALEGKYGARHRAALGISENSDAVVVVVSEETGRISIAYNGYIDVVPFDNFASYFTDIMERESEIDDTKN